jgi:hypothetical protein
MCVVVVDALSLFLWSTDELESLGSLEVDEGQNDGLSFLD